MCQRPSTHSPNQPKHKQPQVTAAAVAGSWEQFSAVERSSERPAAPTLLPRYPPKPAARVARSPRNVQPSPRRHLASIQFFEPGNPLRPSADRHVDPGRVCGSNGVSGLTHRPHGRWGRCRDDRDTERRDEEETGRGVGGAAGRDRAGAAGQGAGPVVDRPGRAAQAADQDGARDGAQRGDDRAPRIRQARSGGGRVGQCPQRQPVEDGADRRHRSGRHRRAPGSGRHVRTADRAQAAASAVRRRRGGAVVVCQGIDHRGDLGALRRDLRGVGVQGDDLADHRQGGRGDERLVSRGRWNRSTRRCSSTRS